MANAKTNSFFINGKLSVILDGGAGSSGKGKIGAYMVKNSHKVNFVCNTFMPQASHTIIEKDENDEKTEYIYKQLNSCAHYHEKFEKMYIGQGSVIDVEALFKEIKMSGIPKHKLGISPIATILQDIDTKFEEGKVDLEGNPIDHDGTIKFGSTCSGVGAARARKVLRRPNIKLARDIEELKPYLCDVSAEIMERLDKNYSGLLEIAQGFALSYGLSQFYPYCTSRNCTIAAGFDDMMLPTHYLGNVCINFRTYPIRIHPKKYITVPTKEQKMMEEAATLTCSTNKEKTKIDVEIPAGSPERPDIAEKIAKQQDKLAGSFQVFFMKAGTRSNMVIPLELKKRFLKYEDSLKTDGGSDFVMENDQFMAWYSSKDIQAVINKRSATKELKVEESTKEPSIYSKKQDISDKEYLTRFVPRHLTWDEVQSGKIPYEEIESYSGDFYPDQNEITWKELTKLAGAPDLIMECTTLTKLPRRVATFSQTNLLESIQYNQTPHQIWISINFLNYISWGMNGITNDIDEKSKNWLDTMIKPVLRRWDNVYLKLLGTGACTDETIMIE